MSFLKDKWETGGEWESIRVSVRKGHRKSEDRPIVRERKKQWMGDGGERERDWRKKSSSVRQCAPLFTVTLSVTHPPAGLSCSDHSSWSSHVLRIIYHPIKYINHSTWQNGVDRFKHPDWCLSADGKRWSPLLDNPGKVLGLGSVAFSIQSIH